MSYTNQPPAPPPPGAPGPYGAYGPYGQTPPPTQTNGLAIGGFVVSLLGLLGSWIPFVNVVAILMGIVGAVLAGIGLAKAGRIGSGKGLAVAGIVLGILTVIASILINVLLVGAVDKVITEGTSNTVEGEGISGDAGSDRDDPVPIGTAISGGDWTVTVNSVSTVDQDKWGSSPADGHTLLVVNLTATYDGNDPQGDSPWATVEFVGADGTTHDSSSGSTMFIAENDFDNLTTVHEGASVEGDHIIEVPDDWQDGVLAVSPGMFSDDTFVAVQ